MVEWKAKQEDLSTYQLTIDQLNNDIHRLQQSKQELNKKESILYDEIEATETKIADLTEDIKRVDQDEKEIKEQINEIEIKNEEKKQLKQYQTSSCSRIE